MNALKKPIFDGSIVVPAPAERQRPALKFARDRIFDELKNHRNRFVAMLAPDSDFSLADLAAGIGMLGAQITGNAYRPKNNGHSAFDHRSVLLQIAAHCVGWLEQLKAGEVFNLIHSERERQNELLRTGKILFNCASPVVDAKRKFRVLFEEGGEVAEAVDMHENSKGGKNAAIAHLIDELVQTAAVSVAWLESLDKEGRKA